MSLMSQAWRNVFRNRRRTVLCGSLIAFGTAALMVTDGVTEGMIEAMVKNMTFMGEASVAARGALATREVEKTLPNPEHVIAAISADKSVKAYSRRVASFAMLSSPDNAQPVMLYGIEPQREAQMSGFDAKRHAGEAMSALSGNQILLGKKAAKDMVVGVGDKVVLTVSAAHTGDISQDVFRVGGIYDTGLSEIDGGLVFAPIERTQALLKVPNGIHEIAIKFVDINSASDPHNPLLHVLSNETSEALGWPQLFPDLSDLVYMSRFGTAMAGGLLSVLVGIGILNTMFMSIHERTWELGVMAALGTRPKQIMLLLVLEGLGLALLSLPLGLAVGTLTNGLLAHYGWDFTGAEFGGTGFTEPIYPKFRLGVQYVAIPLATTLFTLLVALIPARAAARLLPVEALTQGRR